MPPVTLPTRPDALRAVDEGRANPVEVFVANFEYTGSDPTIRAAWCSQFIDALESVRGKVGDAEAEAEMVERMIEARSEFLDVIDWDVDTTKTWQRDAMLASLSALDLPARDARMYRAGMEAMREAALDRCRIELPATGCNPEMVVKRCIAAIAAVDVRHLDPTPASAMAGGGL